MLGDVNVPSLHPMLTVRDAKAAVEFYEKAFGANVGETHTAPSGQQVIQLFIGGHELYAVDENPQALNMSPDSLRGTSVRLSLIVDDPDALAARAMAAGATELFPVTDQAASAGDYGLEPGARPASAGDRAYRPPRRRAPG